jgi:hypothetical protein
MRDFISILLIFLLSACSEKEPVEQRTTFFIPLTNKKVISADELFEEIQYIALETVDSALLGDILDVNKITFQNNHIYCSDLHKITVFKTDGKWVHTISHHGDGPHDYIYVSSFAVRSNGEVAILNAMVDKILFYSDKDQFITSIAYSRDSMFLRDINYFNDSLFVVKSDWGYTDKFRIYNRNTLQLVNHYWPTVRHIFSIHGNFSPRYQGKLLFHEMQNNHIYELTPDSAILRYTIDIDGRIPPEGFWERSGIAFDQLLKEQEEKGYVDNIGFYSESAKNILLYFRGSSRMSQKGYAWIDKATGNSVLFDKIAFDEHFKWEPIQMHALADGWIVIPIPAHQVLASGNSNLRKQFPNLDEEDNPILCIAKIR